MERTNYVVARTNYVVAVYDAGLSWGGPEEGGWWFNSGSLVRVMRVFPSEDRAYAYSRRLNARLESREIGPNKGKREKFHSLVCNGRARTLGSSV